jgi:hypothetical protein
VCPAGDAGSVDETAVREIKAGNYESRYRIIDTGGKERAIVYADQIDTREESESRLEYGGGPFAYSLYDVTTHTDRAILTLHKEVDGDLYKAAIYGQTIVMDINRAHYSTRQSIVAGTPLASLVGDASYTPQ